MRLFYKHLLRSIRKKPFQPIVLIMTLALAVAVCIFSLTVKSMMYEELDESKYAKYGSADFTVTLSGVSDMRFMSADRVEELIGEKGRAIGCFEFVATHSDDRDAIVCTATRLDTISDFFDFRFVSLAPITPNTEAESAFVTSDFATQNSLGLGDSFEIAIGGVKRSYRVSGISENKFMSSADIMLDITGVMRTMTSKNPFLSALGDSFEPSSVIYVDSKEGKEEECIDILRRSEEFKDKNISRAFDQLGDSKNRLSISAPMEVSVLLTALLTIAVSYTCLYILSIKRSEETSVFITAGAQGRRMSSSQYFEIFLYWLIGGSLGLGIALLISDRMVKFAGYEYATGRIKPTDVIFSEICILLVSFLTVAIFTFGRRKTVFDSYNRYKRSVLPNIALGLYAICLVLSLVLKGTLGFAFFLSFVVMTIVVGLTLTPVVLWLLTGWVGKISDKKLLSSGKNHTPILRYASKNVRTVGILKNTARLFSVSLTITLSLVIVLISYFGFVLGGENMLDGDYAVVNSSQSCYDKLLGCDSVEGISKLYISREKQENDVYVNIISTDSINALGESIDISDLPEGNMAVMSRGNARMLSLEVGDSFSIDLGGEEIGLVLSEISDSGVQFVLFDAEHFSVPYNMLVVHGKDNVPRELLYEEISSETSLEMAAVISIREMLLENVKSARILLRSSIFVLLVAVVFMLIGMLNNLIESYRYRREEFELYRLSGMNRREILRMKTLEILITFGFGVVVGIVLCALLLPAMQKALEYFGMDILSGFSFFVAFNK